ncbi:hypothetical protein [Methanosphaera cuniculi]|uniref:Uncharacterized protein n=2 Tax=Methanosphaera cuniculi TaxID=1077256 RepID=A0A2A2HFQ5_9EURY|nr:hypothetical protein [Methanosphaera cuniculi]PAV08104.1 hypothetical protein ASJ82_01165 [Methanosphaera cuniculi]
MVMFEEVGNEITGLEFLFADTEMYNLLVHAKKECDDPVLKLFNIKYVDKSFGENPRTQELNNIYVARLESINDLHGNGFNVFDTTIQIVIAIREYDTITAQKLLKSVYKRIQYYFVNDEISSFIHVNRFYFEYEQPGILSRAVIEYKVKEVEDDQYIVDYEDLYLRLGIETSIDNEKVFKGELN